MTTNEKVARRKLSLLELAKELKNVSKACKLIGYSRQQFYEIRRNYQTYGAEGLLDKLPGCKGAHPNRVAPEIEQTILDYSLTRPTHGPLRVAQELALQGINVSAGGVRGVWQRHDLLSKHDRLLRLEKTHREQTIELNDEQIRLLERFSPEFRLIRTAIFWIKPSSSAQHNSSSSMCDGICETRGIKKNVLASMTPIHGALSGQPSFGESPHPAPSTTRHPAFAMAFVKLGGLKRMSWHR